MITCANCQFFQRAAINPDGGMGRCMHDDRYDWWYPYEKHRCADHAPEQEDRRVDPR